MSGLRILVADADPDGAASMAMLLSKFGHTAEVAHDGLSALEAVRACPPDVVLMEIRLPEMDGWTLAERIRSEVVGRRPVLIAVTGLGRKIDRERSQECGIDLHLVKPVDPSTLQAILDRALSQAS